MIGVFDSGMGGFSVLREIIRLLPREDYAYYSDAAHCPYGEKSREYITDRARYITSFLLERGAEVIVVACNTATSAAIATLRREFPAVPFVGMEPAVKPAAMRTRSGVIGVLATAGTLGGSKYHDLCEEYAPQVTHIVERVGEGFVDLVENGELEGERARGIVRNAVAPLVSAGADEIVLGCTHYPFLRALIQEAAGDGVEIIDPAPAVAARVVDVLGRVRTRGSEDGLSAPGPQPPAPQFAGPDGFISLFCSAPEKIGALKKFFARSIRE